MIILLRLLVVISHAMDKKSIFTPPFNILHTASLTTSYVYITTLEYHISLLKSLLASCLYPNSFRKNIFTLPCLESIALALRAAYTSIH